MGKGNDDMKHLPETWEKEVVLFERFREMTFDLVSEDPKAGRPNSNIRGQGLLGLSALVPLE